MLRRILVKKMVEMRERFEEQEEVKSFSLRSEFVSAAATGFDVESVASASLHCEL